MSWKNLIITVVVLYGLYFLINIILDIIKNKKESDGDKYDKYDVDLSGDTDDSNDADEQTENVYSHDYFDKDFDEEPEKKVESKSNERERDLVIFEEKEDQSMPVDEFLKKAKEMSLAVEF